MAEANAPQHHATVENKEHTWLDCCVRVELRWNCPKFNKEKKKTLQFFSQQHTVLRHAAPSRCCRSGCQPIRAAFGYANTWSRTKRLEPNVILSAHRHRSELQRLSPLQWCRRTEQKLTAGMEPELGTHKATLILLNSPSWSTAPSPLINSGCSAPVSVIADLWPLATLNMDPV